MEYRLVHQPVLSQDTERTSGDTTKGMLTALGLQPKPFWQEIWRYGQRCFADQTEERAVLVQSAPRCYSYFAN
jgi:hypothetical protein